MPGARSPAPRAPRAWDDSVSELARYRLSPAQLVQRKLATISPHNAFGAAELRRKLGDVVCAFFSPARGGERGARVRAGMRAGGERAGWCGAGRGHTARAPPR